MPTVQSHSKCDDEVVQRMFPLWDDLVRSRGFWLGYISAGVETARCPSLQADQPQLYQWPFCGVTLTFEVAESHMLRLEIDAGDHRLKLSHPDLDDMMLLGTMDCHQMSDLFRWDEYQALIQSLRKNAGPRWAHELLFSFYVAVTEHCASQHAELLKRCLERSELFSVVEIEFILAYVRRFVVRKDFRWIDTPDLGWVAEGNDAYCVRHPRTEFNFAAFRKFMTAVRKSAAQGDWPPSADN
jgi:hypothetical protein